MKNPEIEPKGSREIKENKEISREEKFLRFIFASSILVATTRSDYTPNETQASGTDEKAPQGEVYFPLEEELDQELDGNSALENNNQDFIFSPDLLTSPEEFCFLPSSIGSGLDSEGFVNQEETEIVEEVGEEVDIEYYNESSSELTAYEAILAATREFAGNPYSWNAENHHCSGYVAQYFKYLGFPIDLVTDPVSTYSPEKGDPMPNATTVKQVKYLQMIAENYGEDLASEITLKEMLSNEEIWKEIPTGTVLYLPERIGHHGYDTFTHTAIFMGLDSNEEPMFSEFSVYMKEGPEYGHGFEQFTRMYKGQNIEPYNPRNGELKVFMFDAVEASKRIRLEAESISGDLSQEALAQEEKIFH